MRKRNHFQRKLSKHQKRKEQKSHNQELESIRILQDQIRQTELNHLKKVRELIVARLEKKRLQELKLIEKTKERIKELLKKKKQSNNPEIPKKKRYLKKKKKKINAKKIKQKKMRKPKPKHKPKHKHGHKHSHKHKPEPKPKPKPNHKHKHNHNKHQPNKQLIQKENKKKNQKVNKPKNKNQPNKHQPSKHQPKKKETRQKVNDQNQNSFKDQPKNEDQITEQKVKNHYNTPSYKKQNSIQTSKPLSSSISFGFSTGWIGSSTKKKQKQKKQKKNPKNGSNQSPLNRNPKKIKKRSNSNKQTKIPRSHTLLVNKKKKIQNQQDLDDLKKPNLKSNYIPIEEQETQPFFAFHNNSKTNFLEIESNSSEEEFESQNLFAKTVKGGSILRRKTRNQIQNENYFNKLTFKEISGNSTENNSRDSFTFLKKYIPKEDGNKNENEGIFNEENMNTNVEESEKAEVKERKLETEKPKLIQGQNSQKIIQSQNSNSQFFLEMSSDSQDQSQNQSQNQGKSILNSNQNHNNNINRTSTSKNETFDESKTRNWNGDVSEIDLGIGNDIEFNSQLNGSPKLQEKKNISQIEFIEMEDTESSQMINSQERGSQNTQGYQKRNHNNSHFNKDNNNSNDDKNKNKDSNENDISNSNNRNHNNNTLGEENNENNMNDYNEENFPYSDLMELIPSQSSESNFIINDEDEGDTIINNAIIETENEKGKGGAKQNKNDIEIINYNKNENKTTQEKEKEKENIIIDNNKSFPKGEEMCLDGLTFVLTGIFYELSRVMVKEIIVEYGGRVVTRISNNVNYLIMGKKPGKVKVGNAKKKNIKIINEKNFIQLIQTRKTPLYLQNDIKKRKNISDSEFKIFQNKIKIRNPSLVGKELWTEKYKPTKSSLIVGNRSLVSKFKRWLVNWYKIYEKNNKKINKQVNKIGENKMKAILLTGYPGVGKTTVVNTISKELGFIRIELNASHDRKLESFKKNYQELFFSKNIHYYYSKLSRAHFFFAKSHIRKIKTSKKSRTVVLVLDEIDEMINSDKRTLSYLIRIAKKTRIPVVFISNNSQSIEIQNLAKFCYHLSFRRLTVHQATRLLMTVGDKEKFNNLTRFDVGSLVDHTKGDIRKCINILQMLRLGTKNFNLSSFKKKNMDENLLIPIEKNMNPVSATCSFFDFKKDGMTINQRLQLFLHHKEILIKLFFNNYLSAEPLNNFKEYYQKLQIYQEVVADLSRGDVLHVNYHKLSIHKELFLPYLGLLNCIIPGFKLKGGIYKKKKIVQNDHFNINQQNNQISKRFTNIKNQINKSRGTQFSKRQLILDGTFNLFSKKLRQNNDLNRNKKKKIKFSKNYNLDFDSFQFLIQKNLPISFNSISLDSFKFNNLSKKSKKKFKRKLSIGIISKNYQNIFNKNEKN
ncbi:replication factor c subunit 1 [Anaeramoeba flamelloides]|uniref:Replication factor c subunit 1 n=1 Tax=Anaeramoeba flamelloides TaxID=1746091 RepID=A0ABQ8XKJ4_9EUKA|nr:replication factor c subunit 1 [Anaeramoeba flamelloides]